MKKFLVVSTTYAIGFLFVTLILPLIFIQLGMDYYDWEQANRDNDNV